MEKLAKRCACGILHEKVPTYMETWVHAGVIVGYQFHCKCGSSLYINVQHIDMYERDKYEEIKAAS